MRQTVVTYCAVRLCASTPFPSSGPSPPLSSDTETRSQHPSSSPPPLYPSLTRLAAVRPHPHSDAAAGENPATGVAPPSQNPRQRGSGLEARGATAASGSFGLVWCHSRSHTGGSSGQKGTLRSGDFLANMWTKLRQILSNLHGNSERSKHHVTQSKKTHHVCESPAVWVKRDKPARKTTCKYWSMNWNDYVTLLTLLVTLAVRLNVCIALHPK